jgi:ATP-binding cassette subfamily B protein
VILGPTGSGKSTLVKLLLRFYDLEKGEILVNGINIDSIDKSVLRRKIGLVLQDAFLFTETVGGNIAYAQKKAEQREILEAAAWSSLLEVETIFSDGYNTMVGEKGVTLSGGQKQRVSLARTLLQDPDILILDDVTSAVDTGTEGEILKNIEGQGQGKTTLIISHRLTVVPFADKIVVMEKGKVSASGNHQEVLELSSFYKQIHRIQNVLESEIGEL